MSHSSGSSDVSNRNDVNGRHQQRSTRPPHSNSKDRTDVPNPIAEGLLKTASALEQKLSSRTIQRDDTLGQKFRLKLCETLSDLLLVHIPEAWTQDVPNRLWRMCFYNRIGELRSRIAREGKRLKGSSAAAVDSASNKKEGLERALTTFLSEAIVLYDFLIQKYETMLSVNTSPPPQSKDASHPESIDNKLKLTQKQILHRLLIHRGDLYRYSLLYGKAEMSYMASSLLLPNQGNPYNQLAVIAQHRDQACVALYWYARSLLAPEPFETSRSNLGRLFHSNTNWLGRHAEKEHWWESPDNTVMKKMSRAEKTSIVKLFLAEYVDLHGNFCKGVSTAETDPTDVTDATAAASKMDMLLSQFQCLLAEQCLGDALVLKMICIHVFSILSSQDANGGQNKALPPSHHDQDSLRDLALQFAYRFSMVLMDQIIRTLQWQASRTHTPVKNSIKEQNNQKHSNANASTSGSIRLLSPLVLFCDWLRLTDVDVSTSNLSGGVSLPNMQHLEISPNPDSTTWEDLFYLVLSRLCNTWSGSNDHAHSLLTSTRWEEDSEHNKKKNSLREHLALQGFVPFETFICQKDNYQGAAAAANLLENKKENLTHDMVERETHSRMERLYLCCLQKCTRDDERTRFYLPSAEEKDLHDEEEHAMDSQGSQDTQPGTMDTQDHGNLNKVQEEKPMDTEHANADNDEDDDDAGDDVLYQAPPPKAVPVVANKGPDIPLWNPATLIGTNKPLQSKAMENNLPPALPPQVQAAENYASAHHNWNTIPILPPPTTRPPPGFGISSNSVNNSAKGESLEQHPSAEYASLPTGPLPTVGVGLCSEQKQSLAPPGFSSFSQSATGSSAPGPFSQNSGSCVTPAASTLNPFAAVNPHALNPSLYLQQQQQQQHSAKMKSDINALNISSVVFGTTVNPRNAHVTSESMSESIGPVRTYNARIDQQQRENQVNADNLLGFSSLLFDHNSGEMIDSTNTSHHLQTSTTNGLWNRQNNAISHGGSMGWLGELRSSSMAAGNTTTVDNKNDGMNLIGNDNAPHSSNVLSLDNVWGRHPNPTGATATANPFFT